MDKLGQRLAAIKRELASSAESAGRKSDEVTLIAVTKRQPIEQVFRAYDLGVRDFAENMAGALQERHWALHKSGRRDVRWHFIGHLQRNKVKLLRGL